MNGLQYPDPTRDTFIPVGAPIHRRRLSRIETAFVARRNVLEIIPGLAYRQPIVSGDMLIRWHMMADPAGMKRVMLDNLANYPKSEIMRRMLRPAIGESLFNADGADWKWQRQAVVPVFTHRNVVALAPAMTATAERAAAKLAAAKGRAEIVSAMLTATFDVICDVALSGRDHFDSATFSRAITQYFQTAGRASLLDFLGFPEWFPRPGELLPGSSVRTMHGMVAAAIEARRKESTGKADDLLDHMLAARPDLLEGLLLRGLAAYFTGDLGRAGSVWDRAAGLHPADGRVEIYRSMLARRETAVAPGGMPGSGV